MPYGDGPADVKFVPEGDDERARGPSSFAIEGDSILVLDSEHARILDFDRNGRVLRRFDDVQGLDIATDGSSIFVLDVATAAVTRILSDGTRSMVQGLPSDVVRLETSRNTIGYEHEGEFVSLAPRTGVQAHASANSFPSPETEEYEYFDIDPHTGTVHNRRTGLTLKIRTSAILGSMNVIGVDDTDNTFVAVEQLFEDGPGIGVSKEVRKFAADGSLRAVIPINIDYAAHPLREFVVTPEGSLYHLTPLPTVLLIEEWHER